MQKKLDIKLTSSAIENFINRIEEDEKEKYYKIITNYENIVKANINNLKRMLNNEDSKPVIMYNVGLLIELFLKMILLKCGLSNIYEIGSYNHQISEMFRTISNNSIETNIKRICKNIKERASLIKLTNGVRVNYNDYPDFRYNHKRCDYNLIFDEKIDENDVKHIREVIECIELIMK